MVVFEKLSLLVEFCRILIFWVENFLGRRHAFLGVGVGVGVAGGRIMAEVEVFFLFRVGAFAC